MNYKVLIVLLAVGGLSGCLGDDDNDASPNSPNGTWVQLCNVDTDGDISSAELVVSGAEWMRNGALYYDAVCTEPYMSFRAESISASGGEVTLSNGTLATAINHTITGVFLTLHSELDATDFNTEQLCGIVAWKANKEMNITNCADLGFSDDQLLYDIYKIENNRLYEGDSSLEGVGDTPETRPTSLDYENFYQRQ